MLVKLHTKRLLLALTLCFPATTFAEGLPECRSIENKKVELAAASAEYLKTQAYTKLALSLMGSDGTPLILLDVENLSKTPEPFQNFVYFHECAHHEMGHVTLSTIIREKVLKKAELERETAADCRSVQRLAKDPSFKYGQSEIKIIMEEMKNQLGATSVKKDANGKIVKKGIFKFYMPIEKRNQLLLECFEKAGEKK